MIKRSRSFTTNMIVSILLSEQPVAVAGTIDNVMKRSVLGGAEIDEGLMAIKDARDVAAAKYGMDSPIYESLGAIQDTLVDKAKTADLEIDKHLNPSDTDPTIVSKKFGAGPLEDRMVHRPAAE